MVVSPHNLPRAIKKADKSNVKGPLVVVFFFFFEGGGGRGGGAHLQFGFFMLF